jgi:pectate lyase
MRLDILAPFTLLSVAAAAVASPLPAFPGAEGFGAGASGGRGKSVYVVTNLNDAGPGSLRDALSQGDRTVVFRVSGTINLQSQLRLNKPNVTIAGQTAPGDGICLRGRELFIADTDNVVVRFLRLRPGDEQKAEHDALSIRNCRNVIVDHCSLSWSTDSLNDVTHTSGNVTVQWCILSEPLNKSVHAKGEHGYATGWDGRIIGGKGGGGSYHHNLIAHAYSRAPRIGYYKEGRGLIDCRNNVIYNSGSAYGGETDDFNYVGNYYRLGPSKLNAAGTIFDVWAEDARMYIAGNVVEGFAGVSRDNVRGVTFRKRDAKTVLVEKPFEVAPVKHDSAETAFARVLKEAGATLPKRDAVDARIVADVENRTGAVINSQADVGGWPELKSAEAPADTDNDGMPDEWELKNNLNPKDSKDGARAKEGGYTNLEIYLSSLVPS